MRGITAQWGLGISSSRYCSHMNSYGLYTGLPAWPAGPELPLSPGPSHGDGQGCQEQRAQACGCCLMDGRPALWKQLTPLPAKQEPWPGAHGQGVRPQSWADPGRAAALGAHGLMQEALFRGGGVRGAGQEQGGGGSFPRPQPPLTEGGMHIAEGC